MLYFCMNAMVSSRLAMRLVACKIDTYLFKTLLNTQFMCANSFVLEYRCLKTNICVFVLLE